MPRKPKYLDKPYKGDLKKPIKVAREPATPQILINSMTIAEGVDDYRHRLASHAEDVAREIVSEQMRKMYLLPAHFDIDESNPDPWFEVALNLARAHVPGFKPAEEGVFGRKIKWDIFAYAKLYFDVQRQQERLQTTNPSISDACANLIKSEPWLSVLEPHKQHNSAATATPKTLQTRYSEAEKSPLVLAYQRMVQTNLIPEELKADYIVWIDHIFKEKYNKVSH